MALRLLMMGTGRFALPTLMGLYQSPHTVVGLVTQPDKTGRGHHRHDQPMKEAALEHETIVYQPNIANDDATLDSLRSLEADLIVVAAYGQILSAELLGIPRLGVINVHASLLPKYRGAAPIQYAVWNGQRETGITIFEIVPKLDAGPILGVAKIEILPKETSGQLELRLADLASPLVLKVIDQIETGTARPTPQDSSLVTRAPRLKKTDGLVDWSQSTRAIESHIRAMQPWPKASTFLHQANRKPLRLIILDVEPSEFVPQNQAEPGDVVGVDSNRLLVQVDHGIVEIKCLQPEGKRQMTAEEFLRGRPLQTGDRFSSKI